MSAPPTVPAIRVAVAADVDSLVALVHGAYRGPSGREGWTSEADLIEGPRTSRELLAADLADPAKTILIAGDVEGCASITRPAGSRTADFGMFAVRPRRQSAGLGTLLLRAAEDHAREAGAEVLEMCVIDRRVELVAWYVRRGYAPTGATRPFPYGDDSVGVPHDDDLRFVVLARDLRG